MSMRDEIAKSLELQRQVHNAGANFLLTEIETSLTFARAALSAGDNFEKRERNRANARKGYDTLLGFCQRYAVPPSAEQDFADKLCHLRNALRTLGETDL